MINKHLDLILIFFLLLVASCKTNRTNGKSKETISGFLVINSFEQNNIRLFIQSDTNNIESILSENQEESFILDTTFIDSGIVLIDTIKIPRRMDSIVFNVSGFSHNYSNKESYLFKKNKYTIYYYDRIRIIKNTTRKQIPIRLLDFGTNYAYYGLIINYNMKSYKVRIDSTLKTINML